MFTIQNLIDLAKKNRIGKNCLPFAIIGHFGEAYLLEECDFYVTKSYVESYIGNTGNKKRTELKVLQISVPDIGSEPD